MLWQVYCLTITRETPFLKKLIIKELAGVNSVVPEFYGTGWSKSFPLLEILRFEGMLEWEDWIPSEPSQEVEAFPQLQKLYIQNCPKLLGRLREHLFNLDKLVISGCRELSVSILDFQASAI